MAIPLYTAGHKAYVWDAQHAATLRVTHHVCGLATGTLPGVSQQNVFLGLPLVLMPEEVVLLLEQGICHLVYTPTAFRPPTPQEIAEHTSHRIRDVVELQAAAEAAVEAKKRAFAAKREGGKGKRSERSRVKGAAPAEEEGEERSLFAPPEDERSLPSPEVPTPRSPPPPPPPPTTEISGQPYFTTVPAHPTAAHPWFDPSPSSHSTYTSLALARQAGVWLYPQTPLERARCATYRALWRRGMYMGQGVKFGGEFLVYPGDPLRYHSHFVTTTLPTPTTPIRPLELVAWGRLGTATKKAHLVCCVDSDEGEAQGEVQCYSLEWANFG